MFQQILSNFFHAQACSALVPRFSPSPPLSGPHHLWSPTFPAVSTNCCHFTTWRHPPVWPSQFVLPPSLQMSDGATLCHHSDSLAGNNTTDIAIWAKIKAVLKKEKINHEHLNITPLEAWWWLGGGVRAITTIINQSSNTLVSFPKLTTNTREPMRRLLEKIWRGRWRVLEGDIEYWSSLCHQDQRDQMKVHQTSRFNDDLSLHFSGLEICTLHNVLFVQYVYLATEQAETYLKNSVLIYHLIYICPSLFDCEVNIFFSFLWFSNSKSVISP